MIINPLTTHKSSNDHILQGSFIVGAASKHFCPSAPSWALREKNVKTGPAVTSSSPCEGAHIVGHNPSQNNHSNVISNGAFDVLRSWCFVFDARLLLGSLMS